MTSEDELERTLMDDDVVATEQATEDESMPKLLSGLGKTLATISTAMLNMEKLMKRLQPAESSDSEDRPRKNRRNISQTETERGGEGSDAEGLLQSNEPETNLANEGNASEAHVRLEHDALLTEISHDLEKEEELGGNINQQLAGIVNKRWSTKLPDAKQKEKMDKYPRLENCEKFVVPRGNAEIWDKLCHKTKHNDLRASTTQKLLSKVGTILGITTDRLLQMRTTTLPEVDQLITMNTDALALLGHTMYELSMRRRDAIKPHLHKDYSSLCAPHVAITTYLFGDNLQTQLNDIRASNKISKATVPQRSDKPRPYGRVGVTIIPVLMENQVEGIFYPVAGSGSTIPPDQAFKQRSTRHKNTNRTNYCTGRKQWKPFGKFTC